MKFPFFSHKKTVTSNSKKTKKKKTCLTTTSYPVSQTSLAKPTRVQFFSDDDKIMKRSYDESFCPLCKRKLGTKLGSSELRKKSKMIHNSRQFYQNAEKGAKAILNKDIQNEVIKRKALDAETPSGGSNRWRRFDSIDDKNKKLKELEEIQYKVDNLDISKLGLTPETQKVGNDKIIDKKKEKEKEEIR